jgi:predicted dienelactone hydrolase
LGAWAVAALFWTAAAGAESAGAPQPYSYLPVPGPYAVEEIEPLELPDPDRRKFVPIKVYVPQGDGPFPVILYSHGAGESAESAPNLARHWCSYGYISIHPGHVQKEREKDRFSFKRLVREFVRISNLGGTAAFSQRVEDLVLILDNLDALEAQAPALRGKMDRDHIGVAGHSLGAVTAVLIGGAEIFEPEHDVVWHYGDDRVDAVISISGAGVDSQAGFTEQSWRPIDIPMLAITGSQDGAAGDPFWRAQPYTYASEGDKYLLYIQGANHVSYIRPGEVEMYTKQQVGSPRHLPARKRFLRKNIPGMAQEAIFHYTLMATTAFWDAYLKDNEEARAFLQSDALETYSFGNADMAAK